MNWEQLLDRLSRTFYTEFVMELCSLSVILAYWSKTKKEKGLLYLFIVSTASFIQILIVHYDVLKSNNSIFKNTSSLSIFLYILIEFTCCLLFIKTYIKSDRIKKSILYTLFII